MSFARHLSRQKALSAVLIENHKPQFPNCKEFPCKCCGGRGIIAVKSSYYRFSGDDTAAIQMPNGEQISSTVANYCPSCEGDGVDAVAMGAELSRHLQGKVEEIGARVAG